MRNKNSTNLQTLPQTLTFDTDDLSVVVKNGASLDTIFDGGTAATTAVGTLRREGVKFGAVLAKMLTDTQQLIGVSHQMDAAQVATCIADVVEEYPSLTVADFANLMKNARKGKYGKLYERISEPQVFDWLRDYFDERMTAAEQRSIKAAEGYKRNSTTPAEQQAWIVRFYQKNMQPRVEEVYLSPDDFAKKRDEQQKMVQ